MTILFNRTVKYLVLALFIMLVVSTHCYGQKAGEVMIYCRDGSIYRGEIIDEDDVSIQLINTTNDTVRISRSIVKKVLKAGDYLFHSNGKMHDINGFFWSINFGFNAADIFTTEILRSEHLEFLFGWRFNKRWTVANGLGSEFNFSQVAGFPIETAFTSLYLYGRYYITDNRRRLFAYSRLGVGFVPTDETETNVNNTGGIQWQGGGGIHFSSRKRARFIISLGYYLQKANGTQFFLDDFGNEVKIDYNLLITRPILKFGIEFR